MKDPAQSPIDSDSEGLRDTSKPRRVMGFFPPIRFILIATILAILLCVIVSYAILVTPGAATRNLAADSPMETPMAFPLVFPAPLQRTTNTPFDPLFMNTAAPTATPTPGLILQKPTPSDASPRWAPYAGPIYPASTQIPSPAQEFNPGPDILNIALLGMDRAEAGSSFRTDAVMILSLNRSIPSVTLISFPRDLYVYIPAYGMQRINLAFPLAKDIQYAGGGFALFRDTMKYNFGLPVDHYLLVDFQGFKHLINALDGIDIHVEHPLVDNRPGYGTFTIPAGDLHMDASTALWYAQSRNSTSDFDRMQRQQEVLQAIAERLLSRHALSNIPEFFEMLRQFVESDLTLDDLDPFMDMAFSLQPSAIRRFAVTATKGCHAWTSPEGMMVLLPDYDAIQEMLVTAWYP